MTDTMTSQNIDLSSWDILYMHVCMRACVCIIYVSVYVLRLDTLSVFTL